VLLTKDSKAKVALNYFDDVLGTLATRANSIKQEHLEDEVWSVIHSLPPNKAPGPDGFTIRFLPVAWHIIHPDLMRVFDAL
jgi:hypothetical protein